MAPQVFYKVLYGHEKPRPWQEKKTTIRPAILHKYRRQRVRGAPFPAITPHPPSKVRGTLVTGLTDDDINQLDLFEGKGVLYDRQKVKVRLLKKGVGVRDDITDSDLERMENEEVETETYIWSAPGMNLEDKEWDFEDFRERKMKGWMGDTGSSGDYDGEVDDGFAAADSARAARTGGQSAGGHRGTTSGRNPSGFPGTSAGRGPRTSPGTSEGPGQSPNRSAKAGRNISGALGPGARPRPSGGSPSNARGTSNDRGSNPGQGAGRGRVSTAGRGVSQAQLPSRPRGTGDDRGVSGGQGATSGQAGRESRGVCGGQGANGGRGVSRQVSREMDALQEDMEKLLRRNDEGRALRDERFAQSHSG